MAASSGLARALCDRPEDAQLLNLWPRAKKEADKLHEGGFISPAAYTVEVALSCLNSKWASLSLVTQEVA